MAVKSNSHNEKVRYIYVSDAKWKRFLKFFDAHTSGNQATNMAIDFFMRENYESMLVKKRRDKQLKELLD